MKKLLAILLSMAILAGSLTACGGEKKPAADGDVVTIEYWQYVYESKVTLVDQLIAEFEAANPGIKVVHKSFPYADYQQKLAAELAAAASSGQGPNIINIFYGWVPKYVKEGVLAELPEAMAKDMDENFSPMVQVNMVRSQSPLSISSMAPG